MPEGEIDYLEAVLQRGDPTIPLLHHIVGDLSIMTAVPPGIFGVDLVQAKRFRDMIAKHDKVVAVYNGHTHRNRRVIATDTGDLPYFEGGAVKEYPGGFTTLRLYPHGIMVNLLRPRTRRPGPGPNGAAASTWACIPTTRWGDSRTATGSGPSSSRRRPRRAARRPPGGAAPAFGPAPGPRWTPTAAGRPGSPRWPRAPA
jgi:hypothetical protein